MSTMYVNKVQELNVGNGVIIPGHVIQAHHHNMTSTTTATGIVSTYTDLTNGSFTFTPKQAGSKLIVTMANHVYVEVGDTGWGAVAARIVIDGNAQSEKGSDGANNSYGVGIRQTALSSGTIRIMGYEFKEEEYTTTGTTPITIKGQFRVQDDAVQITINKYGKGSISVLEIAQ